MEDRGISVSRAGNRFFRHSAIPPFQHSLQPFGRTVPPISLTPSAGVSIYAVETEKEKDYERKRTLWWDILAGRASRTTFSKHPSSAAVRRPFRGGNADVAYRRTGHRLVLVSGGWLSGRLPRYADRPTQDGGAAGFFSCSFIPISWRRFASRPIPRFFRRRIRFPCRFPP